MTDEIQENFPHLIKFDDLDASAIEGLYHGDITQYLKITKITLQKYLEQCLKPDGQFRKFFDRFATFTVGYVVNEALAADRAERHIQVARYFASMREFPPQIFIQDTGYDYSPASLGSLTEGVNARTRDGQQIVRVMDVIPIGIEVACAATDEQQIEDLAAFLSAAFGQYQRFTCNYILHPPPNDRGIYWEVRIPLTHSISAKSHSALHDDPRDQLWQVSCSMTVEFENSTYIKYRADPRYVQDEMKSAQVEIPSKIRFGQQAMFRVTQMPYPVRVYSDDSNIAVIYNMKTHFVAQPKRLGKFKILVAKGGAKKKVDIVATKEVEVVAG